MSKSLLFAQKKHSLKRRLFMLFFLVFIRIFKSLLADNCVVCWLRDFHI
jgi:hypothetical protein